MQKPDVTPENAAAVYEYYGSVDDSYHPNLARLGKGAMGAVYWPRMEWPEHVEDQVQDFLADGGSLIIAGNHFGNLEQFSMAALTTHERALRDLYGNAFLWAKTGFFKNPAGRGTPGKIINPVLEPSLRWGVDSLGVIPVFRSKDFKVRDEDGILRWKEGGQEQFGQVQELLYGASVRRLAARQSMAVFPEGTRNPEGDGARSKVSKKQINDVKPGFAYAAQKATFEGMNVAILPYALYAPTFLRTFRPFGSFGNLIQFTETNDPEVFAKRIQMDMQNALDRAVARTEG